MENRAVSCTVLFQGATNLIFSTTTLSDSSPNNYTMDGCGYDDYLVEQIMESANSSQHYEENLTYVEWSPNKTQYQKCHLAIGVCKATILSGLPRRLQILRLFSVNIMHLPVLNIPELLLDLWQGHF